MRNLSGPDRLVLKVIAKTARTRRIPTWIAYILVTIMVIGIEVGVIALNGLPKELPPLRFLPFLPVILISALCLDRYTGLYATVLAALAASFIQGPIPNSFALDIRLIPVVGFILIGFTIATTVESLNHLFDQHRVVAERSEVFIRDLNHRVKNHLAAIAGMIHIAKKQSDPHGRKVLTTVASRLSVLSRLYERLHLDRENAAVRVQVDEFIKSICDELSDGVIGDRAITIEHNLEPAEITTATAVPIGLLVNELVTNSIKHAFPDESGTIRIDFERRDAEYLLRVCDDGIGGDTESTGTGMGIIQSLARQLKGDLSQTVGNGRCCEVTFPTAVAA